MRLCLMGGAKLLGGARLEGEGDVFSPDVMGFKCVWLRNHEGIVLAQGTGSRKAASIG